MTTAEYDKNAFWKDVSAFTEPEIREKFADYEVLKFTETEVSGETPDGTPHHWHVFAVVARKLV